MTTATRGMRGLLMSAIYPMPGNKKTQHRQSRLDHRLDPPGDLQAELVGQQGDQRRTQDGKRRPQHKIARESAPAQTRRIRHLERNPAVRPETYHGTSHAPG